MGTDLSLVQYILNHLISLIDTKTYCTSTIGSSYISYKTLNTVGMDILQQVVDKPMTLIE